MSRVSKYDEMIDSLTDMTYHLNDVISEIDRITDMLKEIIIEEREHIWEK